VVVGKGLKETLRMTSRTRSISILTCTLIGLTSFNELAAHHAVEGSMTPSLLGYSIGRWENERTLVVNTTNMNWGHFDGQGVQLSTSARTIERFQLSELGDRLDYALTVVDPETFTQQVNLEKYWVWYPDAAVGTYECSLSAED
jgi:hypothetical protein